jgi:hypothetical protein
MRDERAVRKRTRRPWRVIVIPASRSRRRRTVQEAIEVHHLRPGRHEVANELLLPVRACVDLRKRTELGVRTEDQIDTRGRPLQSPVCRSRPSKTSFASDTAFHSVPMSSRFLKKSFVRVSGSFVNTPCFDESTAVERREGPSDWISKSVDGERPVGDEPATSLRRSLPDRRRSVCLRAYA